MKYLFILSIKGHYYCTDIERRQRGLSVVLDVGTRQHDRECKDVIFTTTLIDFFFYKFKPHYKKFCEHNFAIRFLARSAQAVSCHRKSHHHEGGQEGPCPLPHFGILKNQNTFFGMSRSLKATDNFVKRNNNV